MLNEKVYVMQRTKARIAFLVLTAAFLTILAVVEVEKEVEKIVEVPVERKTITIIDSAGREVTVTQPVNRVVCVRMGPHEPMIILAKNKVVGLSECIKKYSPEIVEKAGLMDIPSVGYAIKAGLDYEKIISLKPDLVLVTTRLVKTVSDKLPKEIPLVALDFSEAGAEKMIREFQTLGLILGEQEKANEIIKWIRKYTGIVEDRVKGLTAEEIPTFYIETYDDYVTYGSNACDGKAAAECGGRNIADGAGFPPGSNGEFKVSPEWVLEQNPDVIFRRVYGGYGWTKEGAETRLNELLARPGWKGLSAVKAGRVYLYDDSLCFSPRYIVGRVCFAKWLHPDLFEDLDHNSIHEEYWREFMGGVLKGVWAYPSP